MLVALIPMTDVSGAERAQPVKIAGKTVAHHQLDFALALGCEKILCLGDGGTAEAIALRHAVEAGGSKFQVVRGVRDLPALVRADDQLVVFAHGLLPESTSAFVLLKQGEGVLVLPAEAGWGAGFERLDLNAAWGGAMTIPGRLANRLDDLPDDAEPVASLLRIARQVGVPERPLPDSELAEGRWQIVRTADAAQALEPAWLRRRLAPSSPFRPTAWLAGIVLRRFGSGMAGARRAFLVACLLASALIVAAITAALYGLTWLGFTTLVLAALAIELAEGCLLLRRSVFDSETRRSRSIFGLRMMWDVALVAIGAIAIDASRAERLFPPFVTAGLLHVQPPWPENGWRALAADRGLLGAILALAAAAGLIEGAFMALALVLILLRLAPTAQQRG